MLGEELGHPIPTTVGCADTLSLDVSTWRTVALMQQRKRRIFVILDLEHSDIIANKNKLIITLL
jgi:hypothetical protein